MQPFPFFFLFPAVFTYMTGGSASAVRGCRGVPRGILLGEKMLLTSTSGAAWDEDEELAGCQRISRLLCGCLP